MRKKYVVDSSVLIFDPTCILSFEGNDVVIPNCEIHRLEELRNDRKEMVRYQASEALNFIRRLLKTHEGDYVKGIKLENDIKLYILDSNTSVDNYHTDNFSNILNLVKSLKTNQMIDNECLPVILVSRVLSLRAKAKNLKIKAEDYKAGKILSDNAFKGFTEIEAIEFYGKALLEDTSFLDIEPNYTGKELMPNEFVKVINSEGQVEMNYRYYASEKVLKRVNENVIYNKKVYGIKPLNNDQALALNLLMDPEIKFVSLQGAAGTGKTLLSVAAALEQTIPRVAGVESIYKQIIFIRPTVPAGEELGFLPGDLMEKLIPWMGSFYDCIKKLVLPFERKKNASSEKVKSDKIIVEEFILNNIKEDKLQLMPTTYMRGRTFDDTIIIIDEAQGLTPHIMKMVLTRVGENSKVIIAGDPSDNQIDTEILDTYFNGLVYASQGMRKSMYSGMLQFSSENIVRSDLVSDVEKML